MPRRTRALLIAVAVVLGCADAAGPDDNGNPPADIQAVSPTSVTATVATSIPVAVRVSDSAGAPVAGVAVSFVVTSGGGTVSTGSVPTDSEGTASTTWVLATVPGPGALRASVAGLDAVVFSATAQAGPAAHAAVVAGDGQRGEADEPLEHVLGVRVTDEHDNPLALAPVFFHVQTGGGTIEGIATATNEQGFAYSGVWTLGPGSEQSVAASSGGAVALITAGLPLCVPGFLAIDAPVNGSLSSGDCVIAGALADKYESSTAGQGAFAVFLESAAFVPRATVATTSGRPVATSARVPGVTYCSYGFTLRIAQDYCYSASSSAAGSPLIVLAAPGSRVVTARPADAGGAGAYTIAVQGMSSDMTGCRTVFLERGITTSQRLEPGDCHIETVPSAVWYSDNVLLYLGREEVVRMTIVSEGFVYHLDIFAPDGSRYRECVNPVGGVCQMTAPVSGYYMIAIGSRQPGDTGTYTLTVD